LCAEENRASNQRFEEISSLGDRFFQPISPAELIRSCLPKFFSSQKTTTTDIVAQEKCGLDQLLKYSTDKELNTHPFPEPLGEEFPAFTPIYLKRLISMRGLRPTAEKMKDYRKSALQWKHAFLKGWIEAQLADLSVQGANFQSPETTCFSILNRWPQLRVEASKTARGLISGSSSASQTKAELLRGVADEVKKVCASLPAPQGYDQYSLLRRKTHEFSPDLERLLVSQGFWKPVWEEEVLARLPKIFESDYSPL
jgi:hypothetical protein